MYLPTKAALAKKQNSETDLDERISLPTRRRGERKTTDDAQKRRKERENERERRERIRTFGNLDHCILFSSLLVWCRERVCVACVCKDEEKKSREPQKNLRGHETKKTKKRHKRINTREREREKTRDVYRRLFVVGSDFERGFVLL